MPFKKFLPLGLTLVAVSGCSHGDRASHSNYNSTDATNVQYRASPIELDREFVAEKTRFDKDLSQRLSELDARMRKIQDSSQQHQLRAQRVQIQSRMQNIAVANRAEWIQLKPELQERYDVLSASVDKLYFQNQATGEN